MFLCDLEDIRKEAALQINIKDRKEKEFTFAWWNYE